MHRDRRIFLSLYLSVFTSSMGLGILSPILPVYVEEFAANAFTLGLIFAAYSASRTLFMPPVGWLADRYDKRAFIVAGLALFTVASPLYVLAHSVLSLVLVRFLQGVAAAMLMPVAMAYVGEITPHGREGFVMGTFNTAFFAGLGFGPLIGGVLKDNISVSAAFYGMGIFGAAALVLALFTLPPSERSLPPQPAGSKGGEGILAALFHRKMAGIVVYRFSRAMGIGLLWIFMPLYAADRLGMSSLQVGLLLSSNTILSTFLQSPLGHVSDRIGHGRCIGMGSLVWVLGMAAIPFAAGFVPLLVLSCILGLAGALTLPAGSAQALEIGRRKGIGSAMGLYNGALSLGTMTGPILGGLLTDALDIRAVFPLGSIIGALGWIGYHILYERGGEEEPQPYFVNLESS